MTRKAVGEALDLGEPDVARLERRTDMYVSGLRSCIEAMGGRLDIVARFPHGSVVITSLSDPGEDRIEAAPVPDAVVSRNAKAGSSRSAVTRERGRESGLARARKMAKVLKHEPR